MQPVIAKRQGIGSTAVRAAVLSLALMVGVSGSLGTLGRSTRVSVRNLGLLPKSWRSFLQFSRGEQSRSNTPMIPRQRLSPLRTAPRLASRSALCGRALSTRTCTSPHHQPAAAAGSPLSKGKSTSSTVTTVIMLTADTLLAYAVGPPSLGKRKPTSTLSGRGMLLKPGPADQRPKNHKTRHFQVPAVTAHRSGQQPWSWESAQPWRLEAWA